MAQINARVYKIGFVFVSVLSIFLGGFTITHALSTFATVQGGTGTSSPSGILSGDNGATNHLNTVTIGTGLTFSGGTLSATGGGASSDFVFQNNFGVLNAASSSNPFSFFAGVNASSTSHIASTTFTVSGTVGIGSSTPWADLSVSDTNGATNPLFAIGSSSQTEFVVTENGNVGINTAAPANLPGGDSGLTIGNSAAIGGSLGFIYSGAVDSNHEFLRNTGSDFLLSANNVYPLWIAGGNTFYQGSGSMNISYTSNTAGVLQLGVGGTANNRATLSLGEIGIGTTTPSAVLTVVATSTNAALSNIFVVASSTGGTSTTTLLSLNNNGVLQLSKLATAAGTFLAADGSGNIIATTTPSGGGGSGTVGTGLQGQFPFYNANGTTLTATSTLFLTQGGSVGVGITNPGAAFEVQGTTTTSTGNAVDVWNSAGTSLLRVRDDGYIGISTTSPYGLLSVNPTAALGTAPAFVIGSSTQTLFQINSDGTGSIKGLLSLAPVAADILKYGSQAHYFNEASGPSYCFASAQNNVSPTFCMSTRSAASPGLLTVAQGAFGWMSGSSFSENGDTALYRMGAGVVGIGNSYNGGGVVKNANGTLDAGFIGIGTTSPLALLDVTATSTNGIGAPRTLFSIASTTGGTSTTTLLNFSNAGVLTLSQLATGCLQSTSGVVSSTGSACGSGGGGSAFPFTPVSYGNATSTTLGLLNGFLSQASSTINGTLAFSGLGIPAGQFAAFDPNGVLIATTTPSGGGGTTAPGGTTGQIQYNENGVFNAGPLFSLATTTGVVTLTMGENILNPEAVIKLGHEGSVTNGYTSIQTQHGVGGSTTFTIPATTGTAVLGTGATSQLAQWTGTNTITNIATSTLYGVAPAGGMVLGWNNSTSAIGWIATSSSSGLSQWVTAGSSISYTAGNVGVGTTTPWAALSVSTTSQQLGTTPLFDVGSTTGLDLFNVMGNGNVGIGTTSPDSIFSINATGGKQILAIATTTSATSLQALLMDQNGNVGIDTIGTGVGLLTVGGRLSLGQQSVSTGVLDFFPSNGGSWFHIDNRTDNTLRISNGVNVGSTDNLIIGTNFVRDPGALSVGATANTNAGTIIADGNFVGALSLINGTITTKTTLGVANPPYSFIGDTNTGIGQFTLGTGVVAIANSGATTLVTNSSHNFGVGTTTPTTKLSIEAASSTVASTGYAGLVDIISGLENTTLKLFEEIDQWGDLIVSGDAPSLTSCTGGTVNSPSDQRAGSITMGTGLTTCGVLFAHPYPSGSTVHVFLNEDSGTILGFDAQSVSITGFTITAASIATGDVVSYTVVATQ